MATYCVSDIHGEYQKFLQLLETINFSENDTMYILGDMLDRGPQPLELIRDIMQRENVTALAGNHELVAAICLIPMLNLDSEMELSDIQFGNIISWCRDGGNTTHDQFVKLSKKERFEFLDWLTDLNVYYELKIGDEEFVLVHTGFGDDFSPEKPLESYNSEEYLFSRVDYKKVYFPDKYLVTGHTPTQLIPENNKQAKIYRANRHISIDCGCTFGGKLAALCLETGEEFYV